MRPKFKFILFALLAVCFTAQADVIDETLTLGTSRSSKTDYGFGENSQYFYSQQLITAAEMQNRACTITDIAFQIATTAGTTTGTLEIFLCETETEAFTQSTDRIAASNFTQVYADSSATLGSTTTGWKQIHFDTEFSYSGTKNLVIAVRSTKTTPVAVKYRYSTKSSTYLRGVNPTYMVTFNAMTPYDGAPNVKLVTQYQNCGSTHTFTSNSYSEKGFGVCDVCHNEIKTKYQEFAYNSTLGGYEIDNAGKLMYLAQAWEDNTIMYFYDYYLTKDINLTGLTWTPIGVNRVFCGNIYGPCTISGLSADIYLFDTFKTNGYTGTNLKGTINNICLESGKFINSVNNNYVQINYCLTKGSGIVNSGNYTNNNAFYVANTSNENGGRTSTQMASGEIAYNLSNGGSSKWRQTIGTDNYPVLDDTHQGVYRYTQCETTNYIYTNEESMSGTHVTHNFVNSVCDRTGCPNNMPTTISGNVSLSRSYSYTRTVDATVSGTISFKNYYTDEEKNNWQAICLPFSMTYTSANASNYELAKLYRYDGNEIKITKMNVGDVTEANETYVIRPFVNTITFKANNANLSGLSSETTVLETDDEIITIVKNYTKNASVTTNKMYMMNNALQFPTTTAKMAPFRWIANPQSKKEGDWQGADSISLTPIYLEYAIEDNGSNAYTIASDIEVANFTYTRSITNVNKWQAFYVPFEVTVDADLLDSTDVATFKDVVTLADGKTDAIVVEKLETGAVIDAHTPFLLRIKRDIIGPFTFKFNDVTLPGKPASNTVKVLKSDLATYTITGVYDVYKDIYNTWYAVSKSDGQFHKAKVHNDTKLPPYRFYMTIASHNPSSELRFSCVEEEELTSGIANIQTANNGESYYTIDGKRVSSAEDLEPGFYIKNGKKMMIKK